MRTTHRIDTLISVVPHSPTIGRLAELVLRKGDVDRDHYYGQDDGQDQQPPQDLTLLLRLHRVAFLQGVEPCIEPDGGQELLVAACFCEVSNFVRNYKGVRIFGTQGRPTSGLAPAARSKLTFATPWISRARKCSSGSFVSTRLRKGVRAD